MFEWVDAETKTQSAIVGKTMKEIEEKNEEEWKQFSQYDIETRYDPENVRQDVIPEGLKAKYTKDHLIQNVSLSADFNPMVHYDLSQYLSQLILVCHEADDDFQRDIQRIFSVDKETKKNKELGLHYKRGPVKKLERCYAKCQSDYREMAFPTAAHVLDIVRCSLVFNDVSCMLFSYCFPNYQYLSIMTLYMCHSNVKGNEFIQERDGIWRLLYQGGGSRQGMSSSIE